MKELTKILAENLEVNEKRLNDYYEDDTDTRSECHPEIEQIRANIINLQCLIIRNELGITDKDEAIEWLFRNDLEALLK